jgi:predicted amidohydrolase
VNTLHVAAVQFHHRAGDKEGNLDGIHRLVERAAAQGVDLIAFPEMCVTGYWHVRRLERAGIEALAEPIPSGPTAELVLGWAAGTGMTIGVGLIERSPTGVLFNSYLVALPDGRVAVHRKLHSFESEHIASGDTFTVFELPNGTRAGVLICWDNNLVENVRITALLGAEILIAPHQTGGCDSRSPHAMGLIDPELWHRRHLDPDRLAAEFAGPKGRGWLMRWLPARAHDNGMFLVFSNGVGLDDGEVRTGNAMILDPYGRTINESEALDTDMITAELDLGLLDRCTGQRWIRGRRPELYQQLVAPADTLDARQARFSTAPTRRARG